MSSNKKDYVRPTNPKQEGQYFMLIFDREIIGINNITQKEPTRMSVIEK